MFAQPKFNPTTWPFSLRFAASTISCCSFAWKAAAGIPESSKKGTCLYIQNPKLVSSVCFWPQISSNAWDSVGQPCTKAISTVEGREHVFQITLDLCHLLRRMPKPLAPLFSCLPPRTSKTRSSKFVCTKFRNNKSRTEVCTVRHS